jgi:ABC-2 type transport system ATP-binding protein
MTRSIVVDDVSKKFRIAVNPVSSVKERVLGLGRSGYEEFQALHPLSIEVETGQTVGVLGHNGSGKSTLLKCIAGVLSPTTGTISIRGRVASLLELGSGFHPELSGRENVFINASFLGISKREIGRRFDDIVAFSELEHFIDEPVKHYSSGMYMRLGFAVAVNVEPDVLLIDEVLAVGDEVFAKKCLNRIKQFQTEGRTILFVTHAADLVREICSRAIVLDHGRLVADATPGEAIHVLREHLYGQAGEGSDDDRVTEGHGSSARIAHVSLDHAGVREGRRHLLPHESFTADVTLEADDEVAEPVLALIVRDREGVLLHATNSDQTGTPLPPLCGSTLVRIEVTDVPLLDGSYSIDLRLIDRRTDRVLDWREGEHHLEVVNPSRSGGRVALRTTMQVISG